MSACYAHTSSCFFCSSPPLLLFLFSHAKYIAIQLLSGSLSMQSAWLRSQSFGPLTPRCLSSALPFVCEPDRVFGKIPGFFSREEVFHSLSSSSLFPNPAQTPLFLRPLYEKHEVEKGSCFSSFALHEVKSEAPLGSVGIFFAFFINVSHRSWQGRRRRFLRPADEERTRHPAEETP